MQIDAKKSVPQELKPKIHKIFVGGIAPETTEVHLPDQSLVKCLTCEDVFTCSQLRLCSQVLFKQHFEQFGPVTEAQIMLDFESGRSRGFGYSRLPG